MPEQNDLPGGRRRPERGERGGEPEHLTAHHFADSGAISRRQALKLSSAVVGTATLAGCLDLSGLQETLDETQTPIIDPQAVEWTTGSPYDTDGGDGMMMLDVSSHPNGAVEPRLYGIWQDNIQHADFDVEYDWIAEWDLTTTEFEDLNADLRDDGYRLIDQAHYVREVESDDGNGEIGTIGPIQGDVVPRHAGIWIENTGELEWEVELGLDQAAYEDAVDNGDLLPVDIDVYEVDGERRYALIWVENVDDLEWEVDVNLGNTQLPWVSNNRDNQGYRPLDIAAKTDPGEIKFEVIWVENTERNAFQGPQPEPTGVNFDGMGWEITSDIEPADLEATRREMFDRGYRPISQTVYMSEAPLSPMDIHHAIVWRQNGVRAGWEHREETKQDIEAFRDQYSLASISVAIIKDGAFLYRRAVGNRSSFPPEPADSRTVYRLASVSKIIGGILGFQLQEDPTVDLELSDRTRDHLSGLDCDNWPDGVPPEHMPCHHTHTLAHLLSHRSCVPHYWDLDYIPTTSEYTWYDTAYDAVTDYYGGGENENTRFWDVELLHDEADADDIDYKPIESGESGLAVSHATDQDGTPVITVTDWGDPVANQTVIVEAIDDDSYLGTGTYTTDSDGQFSPYEPDHSTYISVTVDLGWDDPNQGEPSDEDEQTDARSVTAEGLLPGRVEGPHCKPGYAHRYSSHAFAFLGAAYEAAVSDGPFPQVDTTIGEIIENRLSEPFGLDSLKAENRLDGNEDRASLFDFEGTVDVDFEGDDPEEVDPDEVTVIYDGQFRQLIEEVPDSDDTKSHYVDSNSWTVLGGGIESSAPDLARLGWLLLDDDLDDPIMSPESREQMWSEVDPDMEDNRGLGWRIGSTSKWHNGTQTGGNATFRLWPNDNLVIAILANRQSEISNDDFEVDVNDSVFNLRQTIKDRL